MPVSIADRFGPYEIVRPISSGGMGEVYLARDTRLERDVALKMLPADLAGNWDHQRRFLQEARAAGALNHPNILAIYDVSTDSRCPFLITELVDGVTLRHEMDRGRVPVRRLLDIAVQIADGLAAAHEAGIVHCDLKPENIMITRDGRTKILDFGLAKVNAVRGAAPQDVTEIGTVAGTPSYMSPEQGRGGVVDFGSDQFSFGIVLYEMAAGVHPFRRETGVQTIAAIIEDEPRPLVDANAATPAPLRWTIERCLAKDPSHRYAATADLARDLSMLRARLPEADGRLTATPRRWRRRVSLVALAFVLAAGALVWGLGGERLGRGLSRLDAAPISYERLTFRPGYIHSARFAPDGETVVYSASWGSSPNELFSTRLGSPESRPLGHGDVSVLAVSSSGEMALAVNPSHRGEFVRGTLAQVGLSGTAPRPLLENVVAADWTRNGKQLGVVHVTGGAYHVEFPIGRRLYTTTDRISSLRFSPDGQRLALVEGWSVSSVSVLDLRGARQVLSTGWSYGNQLAWSPDGKEVWFSGSDLVPTSPTSKLFAVTLDSKVRVLDTAPAGMSLLDVSPAGHVLFRAGSGAKGIRFHSGVRGEETDLAWFDWGLVADLSRDSRLLLFTEGGYGAQQGRTAYVRRTDGAPAMRLGDGTAQALSPDGTLALIIRDVDSVPRLVSVPIGIGKEQTLTEATLDCIRAGWVDDGRVVLVARQPGQPPQTFVLNADGSGRRDLTPPGVAGTLVSPNALWLLARRAGEPYALYPMDGGPPRPIPGLDTIDVPVGWTVDSTSIFVRRDYQPTAPDIVDVFQVDVGSGRRTLWKRLRPSEFSRVADTLPLAIGGDGRSFAYTYIRGSQNLYLARGLR